MRTARALPGLRMGSYLAYEALPAEARGGLVPVRVDPIEPVVPLTYEPEVCGLLTPEPWMVGEWPHFSTSYREMLDELGVEKVVGELHSIGERHGGKGLCLLDHDALLRHGHGDRTARVVFAKWWGEKTGEEVPELLGDGTMVHPADFPKRVLPVEPKDWRQDRRWRDAPEVPWPPTEEDVLRWIEAVHWQQARSPRNPHAYNIVDWGPKLPFRRVVQWIREEGNTEVWGGETFRYKRIGDHKYWTMGATLAATIVLNRKEWGADPQDRGKAGEEALVREAPERASAAPPLFDRDGRPLTLVERINAEHQACALAAEATVRHAIRCGELLAEAKAGVPHGGWLPWLSENFEGAPRTAQLYMKLHREAEPGGAETTPRGPNTQRIAHSEKPERRRSA